MADPKLFRRHAGVGQWIDAMVRVRGPAAEALAVTFLEDWEIESPEEGDQLVDTADVHAVAPRGEAVVQVIPSGPAIRGEFIQRVVLNAVYMARRELVLTTPYFVPDEDLQTALVSAAARGVRVTMVLPSKVDSRLVRIASSPFLRDLVAAGVSIAKYRGGLLHTKSITVDGRFSLFGSLNLDPRSLHLNFEITLAVYNADFTVGLRRLQQSYIDQSQMMETADSYRVSFAGQLLENSVRLLAPLL